MTTSLLLGHHLPHKPEPVQQHSIKERYFSDSDGSQIAIAVYYGKNIVKIELCLRPTHLAPFLSLKLLLGQPFSSSARLNSVTSEITMI
jgi:hypothetical protein